MTKDLDFTRAAMASGTPHVVGWLAACTPRAYTAAAYPFRAQTKNNAGFGSSPFIHVRPEVDYESTNALRRD